MCFSPLFKRVFRFYFEFRKFFRFSTWISFFLSFLFVCLFACVCVCVCVCNWKVLCLNLQINYRQIATDIFYIAADNLFSKPTMLWLIDWFKRHVNRSRIILCLQFRELCSVYMHIYIFCAFLNFFFHNFLFFFFAHGSIEFEWFLNRTI